MLGYRPKAWVEIPNGVDLERFRERRSERAALRARYGLDAGATVVGLVARFHPMKDIKTFLRAASIFVRTNSRAQFVLCGTGFTNDNGVVTEMMADFGLSGRLILLGQQPEMESVYPTLDIYTFLDLRRRLP